MAPRAGHDARRGVSSVHARIAYAEHAEQRIGSLEPGKWADFILIDRDLFTMPAADIWKVRVAQTWLAGQRVY